MSFTLSAPRAPHALCPLQRNLLLLRLHQGIVANERTGQAGIVHIASGLKLGVTDNAQHRLGKRGDQKLPLRLIRVRQDIQRSLQRVPNSSDRRVRVVTTVAQVVPVLLEAGKIVAERLGTLGTQKTHLLIIPKFVCL